MDLSALIFVVLAIAWAGFLIPKAVRQHDEAAGSRLDSDSTDRARVLTRRRAAALAAAAPVSEEAAARRHANVAAEAEVAVTSDSRNIRMSGGSGSARTAAKRRRRVLYVLLFAAATVAGLAWFALVPWWATAIPGALVALFLAVARRSVRVQQRARVSAPAPAQVEISPVVETVADIDDTADIPLREIEAALADDGALWDPLPVTLPTYVGKASARRTVRTIELTGISSSGHDAADTALVRQAEESLQTAAAEDAPLVERKVAGA